MVIYLFIANERCIVMYIFGAMDNTQCKIVYLVLTKGTAYIDHRVQQTAWREINTADVNGTNVLATGLQCREQLGHR